MAVAVVDVQVNSQNAVRNLQQVNAASKASAAGVNALRNAVGGLVAGFSAIQAAKFIFAKTAEIETQTRSIQTLTGSVKQAKQIIQELQQIGAVTPFTSTELIETAKRLTAFGVSANQVVDTTRRLGDVAGATGANLGELSLAYGQVIAKGRLQGEELLQFQERGVALQDELRKMYGMTGEEFSKALSKGQISAKAVEVALQRLTDTGGKYANGAIAQSDTLSGRLSTLQDGVDQTARKIGATLEPALKRILNLAIQVVDSINQALAAGSIGIGQKQAFQSEAQAAVRAQAGFLPGGPFGAGQINIKYKGKSYKGSASGVVSQITNDLINNEVKRQLGQTRAVQRPGLPAATPPLTGGGGGGGSGGKSDAERAAEAARRLAEANAQKVASSAADLRLTRELYNIEGRLLQAKQDGIEPLVIARNAQRELATIRAQSADVLTNKELPAAARKNELDKLAIQSATVSRQLQADIAAYEKNKADSAQQTLQKLRDEQELLNGKLNGNEAEVILRQQLRDLTQGMTAEDKERVRVMIEGIEALKKQISVAEEMKQLYTDIGSSIKDGVVDAIQGAIDGTKSLGDVAAQVLRSISAKLIDVAVNLALFGTMSGTGTGGGLLGAIGLGGKKRAMGGSVIGGQPYLVGERGPELFMPGRSGGIAPAGSFGGGITVNVAVDAKGTSVEGNQQQGAALGRAVSAAVQAELVKQQRPGGLLAR